MHPRGPIFKSFFPAQLWGTGGDGRGGGPKVGTKFKSFLGETNFYDFSSGNQPKD